MIRMKKIALFLTALATENRKFTTQFLELNLKFNYYTFLREVS